MAFKTNLGLTILFVSVPSLSYADKFHLYTGANYITGKYGSEESTDIIYIPITAKYELDNTSFKVTIPWLSIKGPGSVTSAGTPVTLNTTANRKTTTESGLGDIVASITQSFTFFEEHPIYVDFTGKVKFATASESKGLGTGENDYSVLADVYKPLSHALTLFGGVGYKVFGDPSWKNFNNVWSSNLGISYKINQKISAGITGDIRQATSNSAEPLREITGFSSYKFNKHYKLQAYVSKGYSDASSDFGCGFMLKRSF
jgi:hypothetical protein